MCVGKPYEVLVEHLIATRSTEIIANGCPEHTSILICKMLNNAQSEVKIFCNRLNHDVYNTPRVVAAFEEAMSRAVKIQIIIQEAQHDPESKAVEDLSLKYPQLLSIRSCKSLDSIANLPFNFFVADGGKMYRIEPDRTRPNATACMNAEGDNNVKKLVNLFDKTIEKLEEPESRKDAPGKEPEGNSEKG